MIFCDPSGKISDVAPQVSLLDHGFLFGDSIYEVVRLYEKKLFGWQEHVDRLQGSADSIALNIDEILSTMKERVQKILSELGEANSVCRIIISRGVGKLHINPKTCKKPELYLIAWKFDFNDVPKSLRVMVPQIRRNHQFSLSPAIKSGNYLNNVIALNEALDAGYEDALMLNPEHQVTELTTSNVGWIRNGKAQTSPLSVGILNGVTKIHWQRASKVEEVVADEKDLKQTDELFGLSTLKEIVPITEVRFEDGSVQKYEKSERTFEEQSRLRKHIEESLAKEQEFIE